MSTERIQQLERQVASLTAEIAQLKAGKPAARVTPPPKDDQRGVSVSIVETAQPIEMPSDAELSRLMTIVHEKYSQLRPADRTDIGHADFFDGFNAAFTRIAYLKRTPLPDIKHYVSWHTDECQEWLRLHCPGARGRIAAAYLTAILASGDIPYTVGDPNTGTVWAVGVSSFTGKPATAAWKKVLRGELLAPSAPPRAFAPPSPAHVR